jgi:sugar O-acyltransferase (sialic acid O-acetyltransferase NeuD family)
MAKVIIFGLRDFASLAHFYLNLDSKHEIVAFSVNQQYMPKEKTFEGLPIIAFENVKYVYDPSEFYFFAPMSYRKMNKLRESVYNQIKEKGYKLISYISSKATVFPGTEIGDNCFILENNIIQPFAKIGNNVVLWSGNYIGHHSIVKDHVFLAGHVALAGHCVIESFSFLGVNSTVRNGVHIAEGSLIAMSAVVTKDTEPWCVYKGNPAKKSEVLSEDLDF